jgi:hypothetical protein
MPYPEMSPLTPWSLVKGGFRKTPCFNSLVQETAAGPGTSSIALMAYPTWDFEVDLSLVGGGESVQYSVFQAFLGTFIATCGGGAFFLFTDPNDSSVDDTGLTTPQSAMLNVTEGAATPMGQTGDGTSTQFQLARLIGAGVDVLQNVCNVVVFVDGAAVSFTIDDTGIVTFASAPANNAKLTWSGAFKYLCQFTDDTLKDLTRESKNSAGWLWSCSSIAFKGRFV